VVSANYRFGSRLHSPVELAMLNFELLPRRKILVITPNGPLEQDDFGRLNRAVEPIIATDGKLGGILIHAESFPGWEDFPAFLSHLRFISDNHKKIERIAVVTDGPLLKAIPEIAELFVEPEVKQFDLNQQEQALAWLRHPGQKETVF
jgi:stage II sporulation SpoAA-like protein